MPTNETEGPRISRISLFLILGAGALFLLIPFLFLGMPARRDFAEHLHLARTSYYSILGGKLIPSWPGDVNGGYGDLSARFYPPALPFIWAATRILIQSWYWSAAALFTVLSIVGGIGVYHCARQFMPLRLAAFAAFLYFATPFHINDFFQASLLAQYAAACFAPFAFLFTEKICRGGSRRDIAGLAASYSLIILFDLPIGVVVSYALVFYFLVRLDWSKPAGSLARFATSIFLGLLCSAGYLVTVLAELPWLRKDPTSAFSTDTFLFTNFHYLASDTGIFYANYLTFATFALLLPSLVLLTRQYRSDNRRLLVGVGGLTAFSFLMATKISYPLWMILPKLTEVQTAWRWLVITSIGTSILAAASIQAWREIASIKGRPLALVAIGSVLLSFAFTISHPIREAAYHSPSEIEILSMVLQGSAGLPQWVPIWVPSYVPAMSDEISVEGRPLEVKQSNPEHRTFSIAAGSATEARIRCFYYPLWMATANGKQLATHPAPDGVLLVSIPPEAMTLKLDFREPPRTLVSGVIGLIAWISVLALIIPWRRKSTDLVTAASVTTPSDTTVPDTGRIH